MRIEVTVRAGAMELTSAQMTLLSDAEVESICLHELAHLTEPRGVVRLRELAQWKSTPLAESVPAR